MNSRDVFPNQHIYERDKYPCQYCGFRAVDFDTWWIAHFHVDHVKTICHNGTDADDNKVLACSSCNNYKGGFDCNALEEARELREAAPADSRGKLQLVVRPRVIRNSSN